MSVPGSLLLIAAALSLRICAAALRTDASGALPRYAGWLTAAAAAWLAVGAAGGWAPFWPALLVAAIGIVDRRGRSTTLWAGCDAALVIGLGMLSVPMLAPSRIGATAFLMAAVGLSLDLVLRRCTAALRRAARWAAAPLAGGVLFFVVVALMPPIGERGPRDWGEAISLSSGIVSSVVPGERRIPLETGAVAWFNRPPDEQPAPGALFFHGAHPDGAHQPAAVAARRALVHAGFAVLAVDHPGFGASPHPDLAAEMAAWDPLPTYLAAYEALRSLPGVRSVMVVGHSTGELGVLGLLSAGVALDAAVLMGANLPPSDMVEQTEAYWDRRFLSDQGITAPPEGFPVREIRRRYLDRMRYISELSVRHAPVRFVTFGVEWPNLVANRDRLYQILPGPKQLWPLPDVTHYLSTKGWRRLGLVIGDTGVARRLAAAFERLQ
jgi:pimeloyl-ACP methyl ester carboxylesterase